jgi:malate synthase
MEVPFMRSYALALVKACHKRGAPAMGGMSALIPIKNDPVANEKALAGIRHDKTRDANDGFDGGWVAHPGWCRSRRLNSEGAGRQAQPVGKAARRELRPQGLAQLPARATHHRSRRAQQHQRWHPLPRLLARRQRLRADPQPDGRRRHGRDQPLAGLAVGPSPKGVLDDGRKVTADMVRAIIPEELAKVKATVTAQGEKTETYDQAAKIFEEMSLADNYPEFLTLPLYEAME